MEAMPAARPSEWGDYQREFRERFNAAEDVPSVPIRWRYQEALDTPSFGGAIGALIGAILLALRIGQRKSANSQPIVALWPVDAPVGTPAGLHFECESVPTETEGEGCLFGEFALNGALCLRTNSGELIWPVYNPRPPALFAPRL